MDQLAILWFIVGNYFVFSSTTCHQTASPVYYLSLALTVYGYFVAACPLLYCIFIMICLPCLSSLCQGSMTIKPTTPPQQTKSLDLFQFKPCSDDHHPTPHSLPQVLPAYSQSTPTPTPTSTPTPTPTLNSHTQDVESLIPIPRLTAIQCLLIWLGIRAPFIPSPTLSLPTYEFQKEEYPECIICLSDYEHGDTVCRLGCRHHFHHACLTQWIDIHSICPMCKSKI
ncbi:hypothetical protein BDF14DRAFT_1788795 [Spinellus fusiger]|nr:hypothetical protein BDF14DRAFT_1788795 [Spinellus fusiger]